MVWGLIVSAIGTFAMVLSMAEICHVYPLSGGQYHWACEHLPLGSRVGDYTVVLTTFADLLAPAGWGRSLSYYTGWMAAAGWVSLAATGSSLGANFIIG